MRRAAARTAARRADARRRGAGAADAAGASRRTRTGGLAGCGAGRRIRPARPGGGRRGGRPVRLPRGRRVARPARRPRATRGPIGLWVRGRPDLRLWALRSVAVVGARACTDVRRAYGGQARRRARRARAGWWSRAPRTAWTAPRTAAPSRAGGATVAVLACGVDVPYPRGHAELIDRIAEQGLVVGELPPGDHPTRSRFVLRNRVIAALTRGTVVVEAAATAAARWSPPARAQRLGRFTMGVPGPATSGLSAGVHELLRGEAVAGHRRRGSRRTGRRASATSPRTGAAPCCPATCWTRRAARVLDALPGRGRPATDGDRPRRAGPPRDDALGQAVRTAVTRVRRTATATAGS